MIVLAGVVALLLGFYSYLTWRSLNWSPMFFISQAKGSSRGHSSVSPRSLGGPDSTIQRGRLIYLRVGCAVCHGLEGRGRVRNPNYVKETFPALNTLAERMFLYTPEDVEVVVKQLSSLKAGRSLTDVELDVPRATAVGAQYESIRNLIFAGNVAGKKDPNGPAPVSMPPWRKQLAQTQVDAVIAYLLTVYPWQETE